MWGKKSPLIDKMAIILPRRKNDRNFYLLRLIIENFDESFRY